MSVGAQTVNLPKYIDFFDCSGKEFCVGTLFARYNARAPYNQKPVADSRRNIMFMEKEAENPRIALAQFAPVVGHKEENLRLVKYFMAKAAEEGNHILMLPEMFLSGYNSNPDIMLEYAEPLTGKSLQQLKRAAREYGIAVVGSFVEKVRKHGSCYNTAVFIDHSGQLLTTFRKIHLFGNECFFCKPGYNLVAFEYNKVDYGILICFDLEFPEATRKLAQKNIQVLLVPSANMEPYGSFHRNYISARAQENHIFIAYCNQTCSNKVVHFEGESKIVNPFGEVVCELGTEEGMIAGDLILEDIVRSKNKYDYLAERRIYFD